MDWQFYAAVYESGTSPLLILHLLLSGMADDGEIRKLYEDWEIIDFRSYVFEDEHPQCS